MSREMCLHGVEIPQGGNAGRLCPLCAAEAIGTLYPHSDEAGRVPGAMSNEEMFMRKEAWMYAASRDIPRKEERNRLVWEAMKVYMGNDFNVLYRAVRIVDEYLAWRDEQ